MAKLNAADPTVEFPIRFWQLTAGWPSGERFVAAYLWTCPERAGIGREGLFPMTAEAISGVQAEWSLDKVEGALQGLERRQWLVRADGWLFVPDILVRDQPRGANQVKGAARRLFEHAPRHSTIWNSFLRGAQLGAAALYEELERIARTTPLSSALKGVGTPFQGGGYPVATPFAHQVASGFEAPSQGVATPQRVEGTPEGARDTTPCAARGAAFEHHLGRIDGGGRGPAPSSAEPHGNAPGGAAWNLGHATREGGTA